MSYKTTNGLMKHLRECGIEISGSKQKRQLMNVGYFHGYKGYRFFKEKSNHIPYVSYEEINATILYDTRLKSLFYDKIMFIETAIKSYSLECIMETTHSESIQEMLDKAVCGYRNSPPSSDNKTKKNNQRRKLELQSTIQSYLVRAYKSDNPKIAHFYNNLDYSGVPIWALFEIMTMGDFGFLLSALTYDTRHRISNKIGITNVAVDSGRALVYKYLYALKDLRNAIAHNDVIFDTRFRRIDPTKSMSLNLKKEIGLPYVNFKTIGDYVILTAYYLKNFRVKKIEINAFIREFERITADYAKCVSESVSSVVIHPDLESRMLSLKNYI